MTLQLDDSWRELSEDDKQHLLDQLQRVRDVHAHASWEPYPWQRPHMHKRGEKQVCSESRCSKLETLELEAQEMWLLLGGRGTGKTDGAARFVTEHVKGPACDPRLPGGHRIGIVAPTLGDAVESCINGPSGLAAHYPGCKVWTQAGGTFVRFPNGALGKLFGAHTPDDVERLRAGGNRCLVWWEELGAWRRLEDAMTHSRLGLRVGANPVLVGSTTPKVRKPIRELIADPDVFITRGKTADAHQLDEATRRKYLDKYGGTRLGRQELDGEVMEDVEGALWSWESIDAGRILDPRFDLQALCQQLRRIVVAIDPAATNKEDSDETGIVAAGRSSRDHCPICGKVDAPHMFVLADRSGHYSPDGWAHAAVDLYDELGADAIIGEVNNGGDMVGHVVKTVRESVPYRDVRATRGKQVRAEPVAAFYYAKPTTRVHHVGSFAELEDQQTEWTGDPSDDSPDRMDALVWAGTDLLVKGATGSVSTD